MNFQKYLSEYTRYCDALSKIQALQYGGMGCGVLGSFSQRIASLGILQSEEDVQLTGRTHKFLHYTTPTLHHNTHNTTTLKANWGGCSVRHTHWFPHNAHTHTLLVLVFTLFNFAQQNTNSGSKREDAVQIWKYCKKKGKCMFLLVKPLYQLAW